MKISRRHIYFFSLLAMAIFVVGCSQETSVLSEKSEVPVKVSPVTFGSLSDSNLLAGTVIPSDQADVSPKASAEITEILVEKGDEVQPGDPIAVLDDFAEQNALKKAENVLKQQENALKQSQNALEQQQHTLRQQENAKKQQENGLKQQQNVLEQQKVALKQAQSSKKNAENGKRTAENNHEQSKVALKQAEASLAEARKSKNDNIENISFQIESAEIALKQTEQNFNRVKALYEEGLASKQNHDDAKSAVDNAKNSLAQVKATKAQASSDIGLKSLEASVDQARVGVNIAKSAISDAEVGIEQAEYSIEQAEKSVEQAEMSVDQAQMAVDQAQIGVDQAQTAVNQAQMAVDQAQMAVDSAKLDVDAAQENLDNKTVVAPIGGHITELHAEVGELGSPQAPLVTIVAVDEVKVSVNVLPEVLQTLEEGDTLEVRVDGVADELTGTISYISPLSSGSGLFTVEADLAGGTESDVRPGMIASFVLDEVLAVDSVLVPTEAIVQKEGLNVIFVIENDEAVQKEVQVNHYGTEQTAISGDIDENAQVVISGQNLLEDGDAVIIMEEE